VCALWAVSAAVSVWGGGYWGINIIIIFLISSQAAALQLIADGIASLRLRLAHGIPRPRVELARPSLLVTARNTGLSALARIEIAGARPPMVICLPPQGTRPPHSSRHGPQRTQHKASTAATPRRRHS